MTPGANESVREEIRRAQSGDATAMQRLVEGNLPLVKFVVRRYLHRGKPYEDLYQYGCLGLLQAIRRFDTHYEVAFSTYAVPVMMGEIQRFLRDDHPMRVSRAIRENATRIAAYVEQAERATGQSPRAEEIARALGLTQEDVLMASSASRPVRSLSEPVLRDEESVSLEDTIGVDPTEEIDRRLTLSQTMDRLTSEERLLIEQRYFERKTQTEIAALLHTSQVRVSRMERRILAQMRTYMGAG